MIALNARAKLDRQPEAAVAAAFLRAAPGRARLPRWRPTTGARAVASCARTGEHLELVAVSLLAAILVAVPAGDPGRRAARAGPGRAGGGRRRADHPLAGAAGVHGAAARASAPLPATVALFLYSLLPIVRNTHAGLVGRAARSSASRPRRWACRRGAILRLVELPLASRSILAGIKSAAVINVGTATLGALVGAGGFGQPIFTGVRLDDVGADPRGRDPGVAAGAGGARPVRGRRALVVPRGLRLRRAR